MEHYKDPIGPEEYMEPSCLLCGEQFNQAPEIKPVPQKRIVDKVNEYMSRRDYAGVERHLSYWLEEAELGGDLRGQLTIRNEFIGHFRKTGNGEKAFENIMAALELLDQLEMQETSSAAVTYINAGTACNAFEDNERALTLFEKALALCNAGIVTDPAFIGGLYNNMALTLVSLGRYREAYPMYDRAMKTMEQVPGGELECAITLLNIANAKEYELGLEEAEEEIGELLEKAYELLDHSQAPRDGYYAFVCEKCAPTFSYYGYFADAAELTERAERIYERP